MLRLNDFFNRRGLPKKIRSDCATYFRSAKKRLHEILGSTEISNSSTKRGIEWVHNCPGTPHMGGAWEVLIGCIRRTLTVSLKDFTPTLDTFRSYVIEAENIVNNRPLSTVPVNVEDEEPLTPNHFLIGSSNNRQDVRTINTKIGLRKQLNILKTMKNKFWKRWVNEYVPCFNIKSKWFQDPKIFLKLNDLVIIENNGQWTKGVVKKIYNGDDQRSRFFDISTRFGVVKKHGSKILVPNFSEGRDCSD